MTSSDVEVYIGSDESQNYSIDLLHLKISYKHSAKPFLAISEVLSHILLCTSLVKHITANFQLPATI